MNLGDYATKDMNASFISVLPLEITSSSTTNNNDDDREKIKIKNKIKRKGSSHRLTSAPSNFTLDQFLISVPCYVFFFPPGIPSPRSQKAAWFQAKIYNHML